MPELSLLGLESLVKFARDHVFHTDQSGVRGGRIKYDTLPEIGSIVHCIDI